MFSSAALDRFDEVDDFRGLPVVALFDRLNGLSIVTPLGRLRDHQRPTCCCTSSLVFFWNALSTYTFLA